MNQGNYLFLFTLILCLVSFCKSASVYSYTCANNFTYAQSTKNKFYLTVGKKVEINKKYHDTVTYGMKKLCKYYPKLITNGKITSYSHSKEQYTYKGSFVQSNIFFNNPKDSVYNMRIIEKSIEKYVNEGKAEDYEGLIFSLRDDKLYRLDCNDRVCVTVEMTKKGGYDTQKFLYM